MTAPLLDTMRRGACPSLSAPMQTGDGFLSRVALTGPVTPRDLIALCEAALRHGSGLIDISARGNLQARGLSAESAGLFESEIRALGFPLRAGIAIETGPLSGLDPEELCDPRPLAEVIRRGADRLGLSGQLAPKTAVVIDGAGRLPLSALLADIRLKATGKGWLLFSGGTERSGAAHALLADETAADKVLALLAVMAERGPRFRGRDFTGDDVRRIIGLPNEPQILCPPMTEAEDGSPFGIFPLKDGQLAVGVGPAFGQMTAALLAELMEKAERAGCHLVRPAPGHALLLMAKKDAAPRLAGIAAAMNLISRADDPRTAIAVCPGRPGCASGHFDTHTLAGAVASLPGLSGGVSKVHISGCAKGCAHPEPAPVTLSGTADGINFILDGRASDPPVVTLDPGQASATLRKLSAFNTFPPDAVTARAVLLQESP